MVFACCDKPWRTIASVVIVLFLVSGGILAPMNH
jgi:hypothetical protein